jgi:nucleoid-associated protein YgaU
MSFPFVIAETNGLKRTIILRGRSLPRQPLTFGGEQTVVIDYFAGNPVAYAQVIGPKYLPTEVTGEWNDIFLFEDGNAPYLLNFPPVGAAGKPAPAGANIIVAGSSFTSGQATPGSQQAYLARTVRDAMDLIRRSGALLRVEWGSIVRYGFLTRASFPHKREQDIGYEMEFQWIGDTDAQPIAVKPQANVLGFLKALNAILQALLNALLTADYLASEFFKSFTGPITSLLNLITSLVQTLQKMLSTMLNPFDIVASIRAAAIGLKLACRELLDLLSRDGAALRGRDNPTSQALLAAAEGQVRLLLQELAFLAAEREAELEAFFTKQVQATHVMQANQNLRGVATIYYGRPENWTDIADFNGLSGSIVTPGRLLRIPKLT